ncbi:starch-binding protein [Bacteroidia bacterium]|nr:starch-binding protein [Bacteroidia bacterium]
MKNMKNNNKMTIQKVPFRGFRGIVLALCSLLLVLPSCKKDFLDAPTKSSLDESVIFSTPAYAKNAIAGVIQCFAETNSYRGRYLPWYGINTDVEVVNSMKTKIEETPDDKERLTNYNTNINNDQMNTSNNAYAMFYSGIERANLAIRGLRTYADLDNWELRQILGEMLTLRAVVYTDLIKAWASVPARFEPNNSDNIYLERTDIDVILKQLLADLEEASDLVGWPNENSYTTSTEHVNKAFVKALRARLALMAGGYSLHLGEDVLRLSTDPELSRSAMYTIAKQECLDVINSGHARLHPDGFVGAFKAVHDETYVAGNEGLWELPFAEGRGRVIFNLGVKHTNNDKYTSQAKGGDNGPNPVMFYKFKKEDVRRDVSCVPYEWTDGKQSPTNMNKWYFGKYRYEWLHRLVTSTNDDGLNYLYMRYADVLLMAAEAINELDGSGAALPYISDIINRAYPNNPEIAAIEISAASSDMFNAIVDQRAKEFCGEMVRKADLIRWNLLTVKMNENKAELEQLANRTGTFSNVNEKIYYKTAANGETLILWGLNPGELGTPLADAASYSNKTWKLNSDTDTKPYWDRVVARDPSSQPYWPIWQVFIEGSNGSLTNDPIFN